MKENRGVQEILGWISCFCFFYYLGNSIIYLWIQFCLWLAVWSPFMKCCHFQVSIYIYIYIYVYVLCKNTGFKVQSKCKNRIYLMQQRAFTSYFCLSAKRCLSDNLTFCSSTSLVNQVWFSACCWNNPHC